MKEPYDWDAYAETFFPQAEKLVNEAKNAEAAGEKEKASELYLYGVNPMSLHMSMESDTKGQAGEEQPSIVYHAFRLRDQRSSDTRGRWERRPLSKG